MKKLIVLSLVGMMALFPAAAFADEKDDRIAELEAHVADLEERVSAIETLLSVSPEVKEDAGSSDVGSGQFYIMNSSGSTEKGDSIVVYVNEKHDSAMVPMGIKTWDLDGSILTFIYVDDVFVEKDQMSRYQGSISLPEDGLSEGVHTIKAIQYAGNDESGEILFERSENYEVIYK